MNDLIKVGETINAVETMSSRQVAELTGRDHKNVMRDIRNLLDQGVGRLNFELSSYRSEQNKELPEYQITKKGCLILASGYDAVLREKIIDRWEELENEKLSKQQIQLPATYLDALKALVVSEEQKILLQEENKAQKQIIKEYEPKVSYYDSILNSADAINITIIAKDYGLSAQKLNDVLRSMRIQYKSGDTWLLYSEHASFGYTKTTTTSFTKKDGSNGINVHMKWTQKGRLFLYDKLKSKGYIPLCEKDN